MNLPDRIFAIGGAGKAITYELLEQDWVQEYVLEPRPTPRSLKVTIIDTAQEEQNRDLERIQSIREQRDKRQNELRDTSSGRVGNIDIEYLPLTKNIQLHDRNDLIGESTVPRITAGRGMEEENWWIKPRHVNENLDFATGVVRKRGLGKGLYYKAYAEDDNVSTSVDLPDKGKVAVVAGLGGGTGSGVFIDLVEDLKRTKRTAEVTLFGVLPNDSEGDAENANAHAALSELEYLSLTDENVFEHQVLIPIDPTDFGGKKANILQSSDALVEFDRAAVYLIASYYNMMDMEDPFDDSPAYAPFTIGIPQVLRYNVDAIQEAKESLQEILDKKLDALEAEEQVYTDIDRFLSKQYGIESDQNTELNDSDISSLQRRFDASKKLLQFDLFEELEYETLSIYNDIIEEAEETSDDITERIDIVGGSIRAGTTQVSGGGEKYVDSVDQQLAEVVKKDLSMLSLRMDLLHQLRTVEDRHVRRTLAYLLDEGDESVNAGVRLNRLEAKLDEVKEKHERLERDLDEANTELEDIRKEQATQIDRMLDEWKRTARPVYEEFSEIGDIRIESLVGTLEGAVEAYAREVENAESVDTLDSVNDREVKQALTDLENELQRADVNVQDIKQSVSRSVADLKRAKGSFLQATAEESTIEKFVPWESSSEEERQQAQKDYRMKRNQLEDAGVYSISRAGDSMAIDVTFDGSQLIDTVDRELDERRRRILDALDDKLEDGGGNSRRELEDALDRSAQFAELADIAEEAFRDQVQGTSEVESRKSRLETELEETKAAVELYESCVDLFQDLNSLRTNFASAQGEYEDLRQNYGEERTRSVSSEEEDYRYIKTTKPNNILQLQGDSDIAESNLFENQDERQQLRGALEDLAQNTHNPKYTGIKKRRLSSGRSRYEDMKIVVGVMSRAVNQIADVADLEPVFEGAFNISPSAGGSSGFASFPVEAGGNWDIGLGIFIDGIFLDNIRKEIDADGYQAGYQACEESEDDDILVHHTYGLDQGFYVQREEVLNMENPTDVEFFLREEREIIDDLLDDYVNVRDTQSTQNASPEAESDD